MSSPTRDHLLGYLLQALAPDEQEQVEAELNDNHLLRDELRRLEGRLGGLGLCDVADQYDPPLGLANRTCEYVTARALQPALIPAGALAYHASEPQQRYSWTDSLIAISLVVVAACLIFPALSYSRFQAQVATCQNQLRLLGQGLHEYSGLQPDHSFPGPELEGPRAAAGVVASTLVSQNLARSPMFLCPSATGQRHNDFVVPSLDALDCASGQMLKMLQRTMGGDFAYNMGFMRGGQLQRASDARRQNYALVGDAPSNLQPRRASGNHQGRGQNVLYEDGRVKFLPHLVGPQVLDDPFHNRDGWVAAGVDADDAVLGASNDHPVPVRLIDE